MSYEAEQLADNPVALWRLDEAAGVVAADLIGAIDGTYTGGVTLSGDALAGVELDGATGRIAFGDVLDQVTGSWEIEIRRRALAGAGSHFLVSAGTAQPNMAVDAPNDSVFVNDNDILIVYASAPIVDLDWHHLVFTHAGPLAADNRLYLDGLDVSSFQAASTFAGGGQALNMGADYLAAQFFDGWLRRPAIYSGVLSPARVAIHAAAALAPASTARFMPRFW